MIMIAILR